MEDLLGPPARCPFTLFFFGEGPPTKIDNTEKSWFPYSISNLEDLAWFDCGLPGASVCEKEKAMCFRFSATFGVLVFVGSDPKVTKHVVGFKGKNGG